MFQRCCIIPKQRGGSSHEWQVPDGGLVNDVTLLEDSLLVAHSDGLVEVFSQQGKEEVHHIKGEEVTCR